MVRTEQVHCVISESFYIVYLAVFFFPNLGQNNHARIFRSKLNHKQFINSKTVNTLRYRNHMVY